LFYVAVTRAMQTLSLSHCTARKRYGQALPCHPSPFLREIPGEFLETEADKSKGPATKESAKSAFAAMRMAAS
jgi:superfamily I DNA/RNA helicase